MANLYRLQGKRDEMVEEYLDYVTQTPANIGYVKNLLQILLTKPEELESLERLLTDRVQSNPSAEVFIDLLIWTQLQQKIFMVHLYKLVRMINAFAKTSLKHWRLHKLLLTILIL